MTNKHGKDVYIDDLGVKKSKVGIYSRIFVTLCRIFSIILAALGILAFVTGNFGS